VAAAAGACSTALSQITGRPPRVAWDAVRMARKKMWVTHAKAARDLGYQPAPAETGLRKAVDWFRANGYC
jgi:dihydroflavonol-4-reductase